MSFLKLIRYKNLLFIILTQIFIQYGLLLPLKAASALAPIVFLLLVLATLCIAAAGNIINDIYDIEIDTINKPEKVIIGKKISDSSANKLYILLSVIGVGIGFVVANKIGKPSFAAIFVGISALLYLYASYLKGIPIVGNLIISLLVSLSLIIVGLFSLLPAITEQNIASQTVVFRIILFYSLFAFLLNFIREIVKDVEDINGDRNLGLNTLPIVIGRKRTIRIVFLLGAISVASIVIYMYEKLYNSEVLMLYFLFAIVAPLLYFCVKAWDAKKAKEYAFLSKLLKLIMFLGICSIPLYQFVILE